MPPILYHVPKTISSPIVQCLLELDLVGKPVTVKEMTFPELKSDAFLAINPMGTSPAFQDNDLIMWESGAILDFLLERYDTQHKLHPSSIGSASFIDAAQQQESTTTTTCNYKQNSYDRRAKYLQLKQYIIATVYPFIASLYIHTLKPAEQQDAEYVKMAQNKWKTLLGPILTQWLNDGPYFLGGEISAVDCLIGKPLNNVHAMGLLDDFPALRALFDRIRSRPTWSAAYESMPKNKENDKHSGSSTEPRDRSIVLVPKKRATTVDAEAKDV